MPDDAGIRDDFYKVYQALRQSQPDALQRHSESGEASDIAQANVRLAVALGERMDALEKDPNWKGVDQMNDPRSPFNLKNLKEALSNQSREFCYQFDANGQLVSWAKGTRGRVKSYNLPGMLRGGVDVHNHPSESERPFGWTFSDADFISYNRSGVAVGIVHSREGEYRLDIPPEFSQKSRIVLEAETSVFKDRFMATQRAAQQVLYEAVRTRPDMNIKSIHETVCKLAGVIMLKDTEDFCQKLGIKFTFTPNKGYEDWKPLGIDIYDGPSTKSAFQSLSKASPEHKISSGRKPPHLASFKEPPAVTARGYTIGEPRDVKAPRKPRTPKVKEEPQESSNNNYFRL